MAVVVVAYLLSWVDRLLKESTKEGKARVKAELDKKVLVDQIRALKKHNAQLALRSKEEVRVIASPHPTILDTPLTSCCSLR